MAVDDALTVSVRQIIKGKIMIQIDSVLFGFVCVVIGIALLIIIGFWRYWKREYLKLRYIALCK